MKIHVEPSAEITAVIRQLESENAIYSGLEGAISEFEKAIAPVPDRLHTVVLGSISLSVLGKNQEAAISQLFHQAKDMTEIYSHILACNYAALTRRVLQSLDESEYGTLALCARALMEHSAIAEMRLAEIEKLAAPITVLLPSKIVRSIRTPQIASIGAKLFDLIEYLNLCFSAGRFNRDALNFQNLVEIEIPKNDPRRQIGVGDAIDALVWSGPLNPATTPRFYYELLCDYVHPNVGANIHYVDVEKVTHCQFPSASEKTFVLERVTALLPSSKSMRLHVAEVTLLPLRETLLTIAKQINRIGSVSRKLSNLCRRLRENGVSPHVLANPSYSPPTA